MMTEKGVIGLINKAREYNSETSNIEFKDARGGLPGDLWRPISSFSHNPNGGVIVFGIKEDKITRNIEIVGKLDLATLQEKTVSYLKEKMHNHGNYDLKIFEYEKVQLLALVIQETSDENKPCFNKSLGLPNGACLRIGNNDRIITDDEMRSFIRNSSVYKFDKQQATNTSIDLLDSKKIKEFLEKSARKAKRSISTSEPTLDIMKNVGIVGKFDNEYIPTFTGYMLFSKIEPQTLIPYSRYIIRCVRYKGTSVTTPIIDKQDISGTLDNQIEEIQKFILRNISLKAKIIGTKRIEMYEYPEDAIREIVANAVVHRDYMITETYTQINVFSDRIEISNPGNLPPGITIDNIKDSQFSRNEIIAQILKDMEYMEEYGRGINLVFAKMQEWQLMEPIFKNSSNTFKVILLGEIFKSLNERQITIWNRLQDTRRITAKECGDLFKEVSKASIGNDIRKMVTLGLISPKGSSTNTYYEPQY